MFRRRDRGPSGERVRPCTHPGDKNLHRIYPGNPKRMRDPTSWHERHWILEIHLVEPNGRTAVSMNACCDRTSNSDKPLQTQRPIGCDMNYVKFGKTGLDVSRLCVAA